MRLIRRNQIRAMPWKNGGGVTHEIAVWPQGAGFDDFIWRLSMAEVASDGPFSALAGVDRTLTLMSGAGIALDFGGSAVTLAPGAGPLAFPGEAPVTGRLAGGAILDLNVMTRRGRAVHQVLPLAGLPGGLIPDDALAVVARGPGRAGKIDLAAGDTLMPAADARFSGLVGTGDLLVVRITILPENLAA